MTDYTENANGTEETPPPVDVPREKEGVPWGLLIGMVLLAAVIVFAVQNSDPVPVKFLGWSGEFPLSIAVAVVVFATIVLTQSIGAIARKRRRRRRAEKEHMRALRRDD